MKFNNRFYATLIGIFAIHFSVWGMKKLDESTSDLGKMLSKAKPKNIPLSKSELCKKLRSTVDTIEDPSERKKFIKNLSDLKIKAYTNIFKYHQIDNLIKTINTPTFNKDIIPKAQAKLEEICKKSQTVFKNITVKLSSELDSLSTTKDNLAKENLINEIDQNMHLMMDFMDRQGSQTRINKLIKILSNIKFIRDCNEEFTTENIEKWKASILAAYNISTQKDLLETSDITFPLKEKEIEGNVKKFLEKTIPKTLNLQSHNIPSIKFPKTSIYPKSMSSTDEKTESLPNQEIIHTEQKEQKNSTQIKEEKKETTEQLIAKKENTNEVITEEEKEEEEEKQNTESILEQQKVEDTKRLVHKAHDRWKILQENLSLCIENKEISQDDIFEGLSQIIRELNKHLSNQNCVNLLYNYKRLLQSQGHTYIKMISEKIEKQAHEIAKAEQEHNFDLAVEPLESIGNLKTLLQNFPAQEIKGESEKIINNINKISNYIDNSINKLCTEFTENNTADNAQAYIELLNRITAYASTDNQGLHTKIATTYETLENISRSQKTVSQPQTEIKEEPIRQPQQSTEQPSQSTTSTSTQQQQIQQSTEQSSTTTTTQPTITEQEKEDLEKLKKEKEEGKKQHEEGLLEDLEQSQGWISWIGTSIANFFSGILSPLSSLWSWFTGR